MLGRARPAPPPAATPGTAEPEPPTPGATATTVAEGPPWLEELPYALRRQLPPLRVSMVVAAADPAARFVLAQGERRREGEELAPGVRVVEIGGEALLLEFRGQRFRWRPRLP
ncbi:MAG: general secretion pathway protein GspB [Xanthomonadales bacterium]|nr:general secretion pathway protein GspB [Xanthomonadales bacterium]